MDPQPAILTLAALAQSTRLDVFRLLVKHEPDGLPAGDIARHLVVPHNTMSAHLGILSRAGLVRSERQSRSIIYRADLDRLREGLRRTRDGDFSIRLGTSDDPEVAELFELFDDSASLRAALTDEIVRVSRTVGREGQMGERVHLEAAGGGWGLTVDALNSLIADVLQPTTEVARVLTAVAEGDLSQKMALEMSGRTVQGEFLRIGTTVNTMVDQLRAFASEVTRVAREVGSEGRLGGQANVPGVAGTWKDLTDSVNAMASSLTTQVRNIAEVT